MPKTTQCSQAFPSVWNSTDSHLALGQPANPHVGLLHFLSESDGVFRFVGAIPWICCVKLAFPQFSYCPRLRSSRN